MSFRAVQDQEVALRLITNMLERKRLSHALLFSGPSGVGKRLTAMETAKAVLCKSQGVDACDTCLSCRKIASGNHPDIKILAPLKRSRIIDVSMIETAIEMASLKPFEADRRVFILLDAERMNATAQNRFLKTLEEPPGQSLFILTSEHARYLLPTIRSRCQTLRFRTLRQETIIDLLIQQRDLPRLQAEAIAGLAQGQASRALDLVDTERRDLVLAVAKQLHDGADPVATAESFAKCLENQRKQIEANVEADAGDSSTPDATREDRDRLKEEQQAVVDALVRRDLMEYLYLLQTWYRDALVFCATGQTSQIMNRDQMDELQKQNVPKPGKRPAAASDYSKKIVAIDKARLYLERFINDQRVFTDLFFTLAGR